MGTYDVFRGREYHGTVCVPKHGQKVWTLGTEWGDFWLTAEIQKAIEDVIDHPPSAWPVKGEGFIIRKREE